MIENLNDDVKAQDIDVDCSKRPFSVELGHEAVLVLEVLDCLPDAFLSTSAEIQVQRKKNDNNLYSTEWKNREMANWYFVFEEMTYIQKATFQLFIPPFSNSHLHIQTCENNWSKKILIIAIEILVFQIEKLANLTESSCHAPSHNLRSYQDNRTSSSTPFRRIPWKNYSFLTSAVQFSFTCRWTTYRLAKPDLAQAAARTEAEREGASQNGNWLGAKNELIARYLTWKCNIYIRSSFFSIFININLLL